eukprot:9470783-Pyramimonas_sp.AAC.2
MAYCKRVPVSGRRTVSVCVERLYLTLSKAPKHASNFQAFCVWVYACFSSEESGRPCKRPKHTSTLSTGSGSSPTDAPTGAHTVQVDCWAFRLRTLTPSTGAIPTKNLLCSVRVVLDGINWDLLSHLLGLLTQCSRCNTQVPVESCYTLDGCAHRLCTGCVRQ